MGAEEEGRVVMQHQTLMDPAAYLLTTIIGALGEG